MKKHFDVDDMEDENGRDGPLEINAVEDNDIIGESHGSMRLKEGISAGNDEQVVLVLK